MDSPYSMLGIKKVDDPRDFGVALVGEDEFIEQVVEKPSIPKSNMALVGLYKIRETDILFDCLRQLYSHLPGSDGAYHLTDALDCMIQRGAKFKAFKVKNWFDCGKKESLLESNAILLKKSGGNTGVEHHFPNTIIIPPVSIAPGCDISHAIIGPHVAVGANASIRHSIVRDSIIGSFTHLYEVVLDHSLIGSDASVKGLSRTLNIGDNTDIDFG
jgi:glucose-1-phosphate thymidylyltransferase